MTRRNPAQWWQALPLVIACSSSSPAGSAVRVEIVEAPATGDVAAYVANAVAQGAGEHVPVLVYVGATWCEPCREFHTAVSAGSLDAALGPLRLLEFDLDRDDTRLAAAGYRSEYVPLFVRPDPDGRASKIRSEGAQKGTDYVEQLTPRVRALLGR